MNHMTMTTLDEFIEHVKTGRTIVFARTREEMKALENALAAAKIRCASCRWLPPSVVLKLANDISREISYVIIMNQEVVHGFRVDVDRSVWIGPEPERDIDDSTFARFNQAAARSTYSDADMMPRRRPMSCFDPAIALTVPKFRRNSEVIE